MAARFDGTNYIVSTTSPVATAVGSVFTIGCWVNNTSGTGSIVEIGDDSANIISLGLATGSSQLFVVGASGEFVGAGPAGVGDWTFMVGRSVSTSSGWIDAWNPLDTAGVQNSNFAPVAGTPSAGVCTKLYFGGDVAGIGQFTGDIAEVWMTLTNIGFTDNPVDPALMYKLALEGPFAVPHVAQNLIMYQGFRALPNNAENSDDQYYPRISPPTFSFVGAGTNPTLVPHPYYLTSTYKRPGQYQEFLVV